jgi:hypothetical protein
LNELGDFRIDRGEVFKHEWLLMQVFYETRMKVPRILREI